MDWGKKSSWRVGGGVQDLKQSGELAIQKDNWSNILWLLRDRINTVGKVRIWVAVGKE